MAEDVRVRMYAIQENEYDLLRALTAFLDDEVHFVEQYLEVLKEAKATWVDETTLSQMETAKKRRPPPRPDSRFGSVRSTRSASKHSRPGTPQGSDSSEEAPQKEGRFSRALSLRKSDSAKEKEKEKEKDSNSNANRPRSRANSVATVASASEKDKEKDKKRQSVAGWGLSKVSSLAHRGKKDKAKSKSKAGALMDDRDDVDSDEYSDDDRGEFNVSAARTSRPPSTHSSRHSTPVLPPAAPPRPGTKSSVQRQQAKKRVVALHDFAASSTDELSFRAGEQIVVVNEVLDGWWMGELHGKTGLFPTNYTEVLNVSTESVKPPIPRRPSPTARASPLPNNDEHDREQARDAVRSSAQAPRWLAATNTGQYSVQSDDDDEHPFGDSHMATPRVPRGAFDAESIASSTGDFSENERLVAPNTDEHEFTSASATPARPSLPSRGSTTNVQGATTTPKRAPPPPPPRRSTLNGNAPPIPNRPPISRSTSSSQTNSAATSFVTLATATATPGLRGEELTFSPFDSPKDALFPERGCTNFRQDPFKASGVCANCFRMHV
ncbi:hypothetical protein EIP86_006905 [Pleurotus ostreatoroseus]|nr:hypothetical protein EIP86_006905 [Pleurotus ostreatoroseus]